MKKILLGIFLFVYISANAGEMDVWGSDSQLLHIVNDKNSGYLYAENYQHQKVLVYKSSHPFPLDSSFAAEQTHGTDVLYIVFACEAETGDRSCARFFNRRTNKLSPIYGDILDSDDKKDIVAFYVKDKSMVVVSRAFKTCKKPLTYPVVLDKDSDFGIKTKFLSNGTLQLDYENPKGEIILKIIQPDYKKLFRNCGGIT